MTDGRLSDGDVSAFHRDGSVIKPGLFATGEVALMRQAITEDPAI